MSTTRAAKVCTYPGCTVLVRDGGRRCAAHVVKAWVTRDAARRMRGRAAQAARARLFAREPLCRACAAVGRVSLALIRDHVVPLAEGGEEHVDNTQPLCVECHDAKSLAERMRAISHLPDSAYPEWLTPTRADMTIVFGRPGSGKSTWVQQQARAGDEVIDLDLIISRISGLPIYLANDAWLSRALTMRNERIAELAAGQRVWFITTGPTPERRSWWREKLMPSHAVALDPGLRECLARINADPRRPPVVRERHRIAARDWVA